MKHSLFVGLLASYLAVSGCAEKQTSSVVLGFSTDMSVPDDVTGVALFVSANGKVVFHEFTESKSVDGQTIVQFPSTFAVYSYETGGEKLRIQLVAYSKNSTDTPRVVRDSITTVPNRRSVLLRMPLLWVNELPPATATTQRGTVATQSFTGGQLEKNGCPDGQSRYEGECQAIEEINSNDLPDFRDDDVFGGSARACFQVATCFEKSVRVAMDDNCGIPFDPAKIDPNHVNLALHPLNNTGVDAGGGRRFVVLDKSEREGWRVEGNRAILNKGACRLVKGGLANLFASSACEAKTPEIGTCGPWNNQSSNPKRADKPNAFPDAGLPDGQILGDGGPLGTAQPICAVERGLQDLELVADRIFAVRIGAPKGEDRAILSCDLQGAAGSQIYGLPATVPVQQSGYRLLYRQTVEGNHLVLGLQGTAASFGGIWDMGPLPNANPSPPGVVALTPTFGSIRTMVSTGTGVVFYGDDRTAPTSGVMASAPFDVPLTAVNLSLNAALPGYTATSAVAVQAGAFGSANPATLVAVHDRANASHILLCDGAGSCPTVAAGKLVDAPGFVDAMVVDGALLYYYVTPPTQLGGTGIYRLKAGSATPERVTAPGTVITRAVDAAAFAHITGPHGLAVDANYIYFTQGIAPGDSRADQIGVFYIDKNATTAVPRPIAIGQNNPRGLEQTPTHLFWVNHGNTTAADFGEGSNIMTIAKPKGP